LSEIVFAQSVFC